MAIGAAGIVLGVDITLPNGVVLLAACVVPPLLMHLVWSPAASLVLTSPGRRAS